MWATVAVVTLLNLLSTILYILSSFGNAIFLQLGWQICAAASHLVCSGEVAEAVFYISLSSAVSAPLQVYSLWSSINWPIAFHLTLAQLCGGFVGMSLLFIVTSVWMVRSLGILFGFVAVQYILKESSSIASKKLLDLPPSFPPESSIEVQTENALVEQTNLEIAAASDSSSRPLAVATPTNSSTSHWTAHPLTVWAVGLSAGLLGGLFGTPGPPLMLYVTKSTLTKDQVRGTVAVSYTFLTIERLLMMLLLPNSPIDLLTLRSLFAFIGIVVSSLTGGFIGRALNKHVDEVLFRRIIMAILSFGSVTMMTSGLPLMPRLLAYVLLMTLYILIGYLFYAYHIHKGSRVVSSTTPTLWNLLQLTRERGTRVSLSYEYFEDEKS
jgi:uncharacterized membrane protein YfcA